MAVQIIKRKAGEMPQIDQVGVGKPQISFNSDGHIVIRFKATQNDDTLIVLDPYTSNQLREFIQEELTNKNKPQRLDYGPPF